MRILEDAKQKVNPKLMELFHTAPRGKGGRGRGGGGGFGGRGRGGGGSSRVLRGSTILDIVHCSFSTISQVLERILMEHIETKIAETWATSQLYIFHQNL